MPLFLSLSLTAIVGHCVCVCMYAYQFHENVVPAKHIGKKTALKQKGGVPALLEKVVKVKSCLWVQSSIFLCCGSVDF